MNVTTGNIAQLIAAIAIGRSLADAAQASDMSVRTAQRRLQEPEVALAISEARVDLTRQAVGELTALRDLAFRRVREVLGGDHEVPHVLRAAELVMRSLAAADALDQREAILSVEYEVASLRDHLNRVGGDENE